MAVQRVVIGTAKAGEATFWYEYDDSTMRLLGFGCDGTRNGWLIYKDRSGNPIRVDLNNTAGRSRSIPVNERVLLTTVVRNGKTRLDGLDLSMGID